MKNKYIKQARPKNVEKIHIDPCKKIINMEANEIWLKLVN